jgi:hypothetical protein
MTESAWPALVVALAMLVVAPLLRSRLLTRRLGPWWRCCRLRGGHPDFRCRPRHLALWHGLRRHHRGGRLCRSFHARHVAWCFSRCFPARLAFLHLEGRLRTFLSTDFGRHFPAHRGRGWHGILRSLHFPLRHDLRCRGRARLLGRAFHALHVARVSALLALLRYRGGLGAILSAHFRCISPGLRAPIHLATEKLAARLVGGIPIHLR